MFDGVDFFRRGFLPAKDMVEAEHEERVGVCKKPLVYRQFETRLVNALKHGDGMAADLAGDCLKVQRRAVEEFQRSCDALKILCRAPLWGLVERPEHIADFGHSREAVFKRGGIALRFPGITPRPVDADAPPARTVFPGDMVLVVCAYG